VTPSAYDEGFDDGIEALHKLARQSDPDYMRGQATARELRTKVTRKYHVWPRDQRKELRLRFHLQKELEQNPALRHGEGELAPEKL
jgi:hypothetical protein